VDEFLKIEIQALKAEISNLQALRYTLLGLAAGALVAYLGWVVPAGKKWALADALIPAELLLIAAVLLTTHFGKLIARLATYLEVFYGSPWQKRLREFRGLVRPLHLQAYLSLFYASLFAVTVAVLFGVCEKASNTQMSLTALVLVIVLLIVLIALASSSHLLKSYKESWQKIAEEDPCSSS
jgi:hypothetical protein